MNLKRKSVSSLKAMYRRAYNWKFWTFMNEIADALESKGYRVSAGRVTKRHGRVKK